MKGNLAYDVVSNFRKNWQRPWQYFSYDEVNEVYEEHTSSYWPTATLREYQTRTSNLTVNAAINYNREFNGHNVSAMVGFEQNQFRKDYMSASRLKYGSDALDELFAGDADKNYYDNDGNAAETARRSYFGRFSYDYRGNISCRQSCVTTVRRISRKTTAGVSFPECRPGGAFRRSLSSRTTSRG